MDNNDMMNNNMGGFESNPVQQPVQTPGPSKTKAILALVFGILSLIISCCCTYLGIILGIVGIVMAVLYKQENNNSFDGMALAGMICSIIGIAVSAISIILVLTGVVDTSWVNDLMDM